MHKTNIFLGAVALIVGVAVLLPQATLAYKGDPSVQGPNYTAERHEAMTAAFERNDYAAWKALMDGKGITRRITAQNFGRFAQAHKLALQGRTAEANSIRTELGLGQHNGSGMGFGMGGGMGRSAK